MEYVDTGLRPAGPDLFHLDAREKGSGKSRLRLVDVRSGQTCQDEVTLASRCRYAEGGSVVCWGRDVVTGVDAKTGAPRGRLPVDKAGRIAPRVTSVWHGSVYGKTPNGTLDSRTGADLPTPPCVAPDLVNACTGVAISDSGELMAYQLICPPLAFSAPAADAAKAWRDRVSSGPAGHRGVTRPV